MKRPFRILILDDEIARDAKAAIIDKKQYDLSKKQCKAVEELLATMRNDTGSPKVEVFLVEKAQMDSFWEVSMNAEEKPKTLFHSKDVKEFLSSLDVIILDIGGIGPLRGARNEEERVTRFNEAVSANFAMLKKPVPTIRPAANAKHDGIEFFHVYFADFCKNKNCLIAILTEFDGTADSVVDAYLHPFTIVTTEEKTADGAITSVEVTDLPYVVKFGKSGDDWLTDVILGHYDFFRSELSDATNRFHISFAASHDQPVMIVGESGTGKEGIAKFIHEQWKRRKLRENPALGEKVGRFQVVNCGGLSEQLAQAELFGYLRGSFTGADEHRLGKVFIAAGIDPLGKSPLKGKVADSYEQAEKDLTDLRAGFAALEKAPQGKKLETFLTMLVPPLNGIFQPTSQLHPTNMRLIAALEDAERKLQNAVSGGSANNDFYDRLRAKSGSLLEEPKAAEQESGWDLKYVRDNPIGTLFLDEFADLPLSVQTLLLRFLQDGEVQPLGFAGRILGLKVRIIVATSDPRVAEFAGKTITGDFRSPAELQRPLRIDLLHRVRFQEIRTEPVTPENVDRILKGMIAQKTKPFVEWDNGAISYFVDEIIQILGPATATKPKPAAIGGSNRRASFGHRRELSRVVNLVWEYAKTAGPRGVRDADLVAQANGSFSAKKGLIQRLWSPAMIVSVASSGTNADHLAPNPSGPPPGNAEAVACARKIFVDGLVALSKPVTLSGEWTWNSDVADNELLLEQHVAVNRIVKEVFRTYAGKESTVCEALEGAGFKGKVRSRDKFDKHFTRGKATSALAKLRK